MELFTHTPTVSYNGVTLQNLLTKLGIVSRVINNLPVFYDYTIHDGERADTIAYDYYNDASYAWLIYLVNNIYDPYLQWPLSDREFHDYLFQKFGHVYPLMQQVSHYYYSGLPSDDPEYVKRINWTLNPTTYALLSPEDKSGWSAKTVYDAEYEKNEQKRMIRLLGSQYIKQVDSEVVQRLGS